MGDEQLHLFGDYVLDMARRQLLHAGRRVPLRPQAYKALEYLAENRGRMVTKDQLIGEVWEGRAVSDDSLVQCLRDVRRALGAGADQYLRTERGRGYIFDTQDEARTELEKLLRLSKERYLSSYNIALVYNGLGEPDEALAWLGRGVEQRDPKMTFLKVEPKWNNLRPAPRFQELLRQVGFGP